MMQPFIFVRRPQVRSGAGAKSAHHPIYILLFISHGRIEWLRGDSSVDLDAQRRRGPKKQVLYAIDREGNTRAFFPVIGVTLHDWEDIAIDNAGHLFIGDIGNNDAKRKTLAVYEVDEPNPQAGAGLSPRNAPGS